MSGPNQPPPPIVQRPKAHEIDRSLFQPKARKPGQPRPPRPGQGQGQASVQGGGGMGRALGGSGSMNSSRPGSQGSSNAPSPAGSMNGGNGGSQGSGGMGGAGAPSVAGSLSQGQQVLGQGQQMRRGPSSSSMTGQPPPPMTLQPNANGQGGPSPLRMGKALSSNSRPASPNPSSSSFPTTASGAPIYRPKPKPGTYSSTSTNTAGGSDSADGPPARYQEFDIFAPTAATQNGSYDNTYVNIFNFMGDAEVPRLATMRQPVFLGRNQPDYERVILGLDDGEEDVAGQGQGQSGRFGNRFGAGRSAAAAAHANGTGNGEVKPLSSFQKAQLKLLPPGAELKDYKLDREGRVILDEYDNPIKREFADQSKIAPNGKPSAVAPPVDANKKPLPPKKKKRFLRESDKYRMGIARPESYWQNLNREKLPYVLDESPLLESVPEIITGPDGEDQKVEKLVKKEDGRRFIGRAVTTGEETAWIALVLTSDAQVIGIPVDREYRFEAKRNGIDIGYAESNDIMEGRAVYSRWAHRQTANVGQSRHDSPDPTGLQRMPEDADRMDVDVKPDVKPDIKPNVDGNSDRSQPGAGPNDVFGASTDKIQSRDKSNNFLARLESRLNVLSGGDVKPKVKRERFDDETTRGRRGRMGMERLEGEDLDVEDGGPQSDEEGFAVGEDEEDFQKELQNRLKREQDLANRNVGVLDKVDSDDSDDDLFGEKAAAAAAEKKAERKRKRKLREAARSKGYDLPFDEDDDLNDDDTDTDEDEDDVKPSQDIKSETGSMTGKSRGDNKRSRHGSPSGSIHSPNSRAQSPNTGGTRSVSPSVSFGGHQLTAHRALSPGGGKGRSSTPGSSSGKSRKRKGEGSDYRQSAPPGGSSRPPPEMQFNKKQRPNTDVSHIGGSHASSSSQFLPSPSTGREQDLSGGHAGAGPKKHKKRGGNKEGRSGSNTPGSTPGSSGRGPSPSSGRAAGP